MRLIPARVLRTSLNGENVAGEAVEAVDAAGAGAPEVDVVRLDRRKAFPRRPLLPVFRRRRGHHEVRRRRIRSGTQNVDPDNW